jgi:hypothetical protein
MKIRLLCVFLCSFLILLFGSVLVFELYYAKRIYPGVWVWTVGVGGKRPEEAAAVLEDGLGLNAPLVYLRSPDCSWGVRPTDMGLRLNPQATLALAYQLGRDRAPGRATC